MAVTEVVDFFLERWQVSHSPELFPLFLIVIFASVTAIHPMTWNFLKPSATVIHEMGHVFIARLMGRKVKGIKVHTDTSGVTISKGKERGLGLLLTFLAGYTAPGTLACFLAGLAFYGYMGVSLTIYNLILVCALLLSRNFAGIFFSVSAFSLSLFVWIWNDEVVVAYVVISFAVFYAIAGVRGAFDLYRVHRPRNLSDANKRKQAEIAKTSDAGQAGKLTFTPAILWVGVFILLAILLALGTFILLFIT